MLRITQYILIGVVLGCVAAVVWMPEHWWKLALTAIVAIIAAASASIAAETARRLGR